MKLNPECVRSILLTIEDKTDFNHYWEYNLKEISTYEYLKSYSHDEIIYHISQCERANLISGVKFFDSGDMILVSDITPTGHEFLANIRSDNIWNHVKAVGSKVGSMSLTALTQIAAQVVSSIIKGQLKL